MKTLTVFAACLCTSVMLFAEDVKPVLDVDLTKSAQISVNGKTSAVSGDGEAVLADGQKLLKYGEKTALKVSINKTLNETGTIIFQYALEPFPAYKGTPRRPMLTIDAASRLQIGFSTGANIKPPFLQFNFADGKNNMYFAKNKLKFNQLYTAAMSYDGKTVRCYLDGIMIHEAKQPVSVAKGLLRDLFLGPVKDGWYNSGTWQGGTLAKRIIVYNVALTGEQIKDAVK